MDDLAADMTTVAQAVQHFEGEFSKPPAYWIPCLIILVIASVAGTFGNVTILYLIFTRQKLRNVETIFIVNLAISDLYVTTIADPMSLIGRFESFSLSLSQTF